MGDGPGAQSLLDRVVALLRDPFDVRLADSIFGTADPVAITQRVEGFCRERLGSGVGSCEFSEQSVGAVLVLGLESGKRVALRFHALAEGRLGTAGSLPPGAGIGAHIQVACARGG